MPKPEIVRKITARTVGCEAEPGQEFLVYGRCNRTLEKSTDKGPYLLFKGQFEAFNTKNGKLFASTQVIAPGVGEDMIGIGLSDAQRDDPRASVEFGMRFYTEEADRKTSPVGYVWKCEPLSEPSGDDPMARLRRQISDQVPALQKALPAPEKSKGEAEKK